MNTVIKKQVEKLIIIYTAIIYFLKKLNNILIRFKSYFLTTGHKQIGRFYIILWGVLAFIRRFLSILVRMQLSAPAGYVFKYNCQLYNSVVTLQGFIMIFMYVIDWNKAMYWLFISEKRRLPIDTLCNYLSRYRLNFFLFKEEFNVYFCILSFILFDITLLLILNLIQIWNRVV